MLADRGTADPRTEAVLVGCGVMYAEVDDVAAGAEAMERARAEEVERAFDSPGAEFSLNCVGVERRKGKGDAA